MTNTQYFKNCTTIEELKQEYKTLLFKFHPDINQDPDATKICQEINKQYDILFPELKNTFRNSKGETYTKNTSEEESENINVYKDIINAIIHLQGIKIELIGSWLWISGDTLQYKDILKGLKFKWSKKKSSWYYHNQATYKKRSKKNYTMEGLRELWGNEEVEGRPLVAIS